MKILYYSPHPTISNLHRAGYATHMSEMMEAFKKLGHEVVPLIMGANMSASNEGGVEKKSRIKSFIKKITFPVIWESLKDLNLKHFDKYAQSVLEELIEKEKPDLIYERANYFQLSGVKAAKKFKIKHILEVNSPYVDERIVLQGKSFFLKTAKSIERKMLSMTSLIAVVSSYLEQKFIEDYGIDKDKFVVTPNAINIDRAKIDTGNVQKLKEKYNLTDTTVIGFVGSFFRWHGIDMLIKAFSKISCKQVKLMIIGAGEIEQELKKLAISISPHNIIFTGAVKHKDIFDYISLFDIAVLPNSHKYGSPVKIFEYGIMKTAIIAPDFIPMRDVIKNEKDGILIAPSVNNLTEALNKLLVDVEKRKSLSNNFYEKIVKNYTWEKNAEKVLSKIK